MSQGNQELRDLFLLAILPHVVFEGWSKGATAAGVSDVNDFKNLDKGSQEEISLLKP